MKMILTSACAAAFLLSAVPTCLAADASPSPWTGTWKENLAKSKLSGDTITLTAKPNGVFHMAAGGMIEYDFACDGKPYPTLVGRTITCTGSPAAGYDTTTTFNGQVLSKSHRSFSADSKTMMIHGTSMHPDGSTSDYDETYQRQTGTTGLAGKWLDIKDVHQVATSMTWTVNGSALHAEFPSYKQIIDAKLDGSAGKVTGPTIPPGAVITIKAEGPNKLRYTDMLNGKTLNEGTWVLSADGKSITDESWIPGRESEKSTEVWEKQ